MPKLTKRGRGKKVYYSYEELVKEYFPESWKNRDKVCIHCHQEIPITERRVR